MFFYVKLASSQLRQIQIDWKTTKILNDFMGLVNPTE